MKNINNNEQLNSMSIQHKYVNRCIIKLINEKHIGQIIRVGGWQKTSRSQGGGR